MSGCYYTGLMLSQVTILTLTLLTFCPWVLQAAKPPGPSPASEFWETPKNQTVPLGDRALMKCKLRYPVNVCRWYYLETGLDFFSERVKPVLIKDFKPSSNSTDCSIEFTRVKRVQEGQWLCQALQFHASEFIMASPAVLTVITPDQKQLPVPGRDGRRSDTEDEHKPEDQEMPDNKKNHNHDEKHQHDISFDLGEESAIQMVVVGDVALLPCQVQKPLSSCSWIKPSGDILPLVKDGETTAHSRNYLLDGSPQNGSCSLRVEKVGHADEGNWRCLVHVGKHVQEVKGPLIHLHIIGEPLNSGGNTDTFIPFKAPTEDSTTLIIILVMTSIILFAIIIFLFTCLYQQMRHNINNVEEDRKILQPNIIKEPDDVSKHYMSTDFRTDPGFFMEKKLAPIQYTDIEHYSHYLNMTGGSSGSTVDGYIIFPSASVRSSTSSHTTMSTLSTLPAGSRSRSASAGTTGSDISVSNFTRSFENPSYHPDSLSHLAGAALGRDSFVYNTNHLYEEIKERIEEEEEKTPSPVYTNLVHENEGYLIPNNSPASPQTTSQDLALTPSTPQKAAKPEVLSKPAALTKSNSDIITPTSPPLISEISKTKLPGSNPELYGAQQGHSDHHPAGENTRHEDQMARITPYSRVGLDGNIEPIEADLDTISLPKTGYSRVGIAPAETSEAYDIPPHRPERVKRTISDPVDTEVRVDGLVGIVV
ncbi:uncharacterized protein LOC143028621 [Oratosquilla oratoria]|uniref:uncharacterized protein LOC143028621 n=1 Tax=Oratosquilla oratoria TaxID=337810 RepID=UPI003F758ADD